VDLVNLNRERATIIINHLGMNGGELSKKIEIVQKSVLDDLHNLETTYQAWLKSDARLTSLRNMASHLGRTRLEIEVLGDLLDDEWFDCHSVDLNQKSRTEETVQFARLMKYSFGMDLFTVLETSFRTILRELDPLACNHATGNFINIYTCLLGKKQLAFPSDELGPGLELLNFVRLIRNLIHNSSVYFSEDGSDITLNYKGNSYTFCHGKPIFFMTWELLIILAEDIHQLLYRIITHEKIVGLQAITDPYVGFLTSVTSS